MQTIADVHERRQSSASLLRHIKCKELELPYLENAGSKRRLLKDFSIGITGARAMGLHATHDCFSGSYQSFHSVRSALADIAGLPPLDLMQGYMTREDHDNESRTAALVSKAVTQGHEITSLPARWDSLTPDILHVLLDTPDDGGEISPELCGPLSVRLSELLPRVGELPFDDATEPSELLDTITGMSYAERERATLSQQQQ